MKKLAVVLASLFLAVTVAALAQPQTPAAPPAGAATASPATAPASQPTTGPAAASKPAWTIDPALPAKDLAEYNQKMEELKKQFPFVPMSDWKGKKFVFLEGYGDLSEKHTSQHYYDENGKSSVFAHKDVVGKVFTITDINIIKGKYLYAVEFSMKMDDTGKIYFYKNNQIGILKIDDIALFADIEKARNLWKDKTLWILYDTIYIYTGDGLPHRFLVRRFSPAKVIDVVEGLNTVFPVRFSLQTEKGQKGYMNCTLSGTNCYVEEEDKIQRWDFDTRFLIDDPRILYSCDEKTWQAMEKCQVLPGMTPEQVELSWGKPGTVKNSKTAKGTENIWKYTKRTLTFENGILTKIESK